MQIKKWLCGPETFRETDPWREGDRQCPSLRKTCKSLQFLSKKWQILRIQQVTVLGTDIRILTSMRFHIWILFLINILHIQEVMFAFSEFWSPLYWFWLLLSHFWWFSDVKKMKWRNHIGGSQLAAVWVVRARACVCWRRWRVGVGLGRFGPLPVVEIKQKKPSQNGFNKVMRR